MQIKYPEIEMYYSHRVICEWYTIQSSTNIIEHRFRISNIRKYHDRQMETKGRPANFDISIFIYPEDVWCALEKYYLLVSGQIYAIVIK